MATIKLRFRASTKEDKEGTLYYQVIHNREIRQIKSGFKIYNDEWDGLSSKIVIDSSTSSRRATYLTTAKDRTKIAVKRLECITEVFEQEGRGYTSDDIVATYEKQHKGQTLFDFTLEIIARYRELGKVRTAETYWAALSSFVSFREGEDISLKLIDGDLMEGYEAFLRGRESSLNTISFYMRKLRAVYNRAIEKGIIPQQNPFKRVYTSIEKTQKRAIPLKLISRLKELELVSQPELEFARDMFLFSFYTRGMSFVDMAYLRKKDLKNGELSYMRRKTSQRLQIKWESCMEEMVAKYPNEELEYLLPLITNVEKCHRTQYIDALSRVNRNLKKVAELAGIDCNLTMYVARHSWASAAKSKNVPISVICEGMGHDSEATTQIYLSSLESTVIDKANKMILRSI